jgi:hypothetical protein
MAHHTTEWEKCQGDVVITDRKTRIEISCIPRDLIIVIFYY